LADYLKDFKRLTTPLLQQLHESIPTEVPPGGQSDLTPLKNKAREAVEALNDAQMAADAGRSEDAMEALRRARSAIDAALGGSFRAGSAAAAPAGGPGYGRY